MACKRYLSADVEFAKTAMNEFLGWYGYDNPRDDSKGRRKCRSNSASNDSEVESLKFTEGCGWCGKSVDEATGLTSATAIFCSELCFSQSRRANFKRNKTCDWCKHVRRTISYVDFQDGASQLQFCSDKCLNQYKMHIFCRETRAHLELHPHLLDREQSSTGTLITPDLWFRNCKSPPDRIDLPISPGTSSDSYKHPSTLPLISVAHPAKLMPNEPKKNHHRTAKCKKSRKRYSSTVTSAVLTNDAPQDLRVRHTPPLDVLEESSSKSLSAEVNCESPQLKVSLSSSPIPPKSEDPIKSILGNLLPPQTVFVPYPVILPLPIPIPIPIPIPKVVKIDDKNLVVLQDGSSQTGADAAKKCLRKRKRPTDLKKRVFVRNKKIIVNSRK
ncbi:sine oculis-binding protein homolog B isoform X2 [Cylas formicarius]|uniref:sine oculis-binding protein homolog B isoform X2 n=1 Tax=Cylas formicarius TaxID=197179 RepID=UPI002958BE3B|nr:sine oculis-binding protein homolog B isoform X2 [Cylas formicarius]